VPVLAPALGGIVLHTSITERDAVPIPGGATWNTTSLPQDWQLPPVFKLEHRSQLAFTEMIPRRVMQHRDVFSASKL
jgi:hypothetical protein